MFLFESCECDVVLSLCVVVLLLVVVVALVVVILLGFTAVVDFIVVVAFVVLRMVDWDCVTKSSHTHRQLGLPQSSHTFSVESRDPNIFQKLS